MRPPTPIMLSLSLFAGIAGLVSALPETQSLQLRDTTGILNSPAAQPPLPVPEAAAQVAAQNSLNLSDIQGDILVGMKKTKQLFVFFHINKPADFKKGLRKLHPLITSTTQLIDVKKQPKIAVNFAISHTGLVALNVTDDLGDSAFTAGQFADAAFLGDPGTINWVPALKGTDVHGLLLLASDSVASINDEAHKIAKIFGDSASVRYSLPGSVRPGPEQGHEHFGFMDGISQPAVVGFDPNPLPGQSVIAAGSFLLGENGDTTTRPSWAKGGSFLAFRQLKQLVPEFDKFLEDNALVGPNLTHEEGAALLGARMVGRWKSGAPVDLTPLQDDPVLAADPTRNNNFTFEHPGFDFSSDQTHCPFSAHIRKTRPRDDLSIPEETVHHIIRAGIPYGPEVTAAENERNTTLIERGLAFVAYQSTIGNGFRFLQHSWANNPNFIFNKADKDPGADPIIGSLAGAPKLVTGLDPFNVSHDITMNNFIVSRGGEYFFSPPIGSIITVLSV